MVALLSSGFRSGPDGWDASRGGQPFVLHIAVGVAGAAAQTSLSELWGRDPVTLPSELYGHEMDLYTQVYMYNAAM